MDKCSSEILNLGRSHRSNKALILKDRVNRIKNHECDKKLREEDPEHLPRRKNHQSTTQILMEEVEPVPSSAVLVP